MKFLYLMSVIYEHLPSALPQLYTQPIPYAVLISWLNYLKITCRHHGTYLDYDLKCFLFKVRTFSKPNHKTIIITLESNR